MTIDTIILAGGGLDESLKGHTSVHNKGFITIAGKMMAEYVIEAVRQVPQAGRIVLVTDTKKLPSLFQDKVDIIAEDGDSAPASLRKGTEALSPLPDRILVMPCDLPLITPAAIEDFILQSAAKPADICYGFLSRKISEEVYPHVHHTYVKLKEGEFCGTGFFLISPAAIKSCEAFFNKMTKNRKNPLALALTLGLSTIIKYFMGQLTVADIEKRAPKLLGCTGRGIETKYAEAGFNVDAPPELLTAEKLLSAEKV